MRQFSPLELLMAARTKQAVIAAPGGKPYMPPPPGMPPQGMPMDPAMMGGGMPPQGMPMDPAMMGGMPPQGMPMDPAMMGGGMPMDPAPPAEEPKSEDKPKNNKVDIQQEITAIKEMLQALMEAQIAIMQSLSGGGAPSAPPMDPAMMGGGMPMDPAMMQGGMPMDPAMMGGGMPMDPAMMQGGMQVTASAKEASDREMRNYLKSIADLLR